MAKRKFATQISDSIFENLQSYVAESNRKISDVVNEALEAHLRTVRVRPAFRHSVDKIVAQHAEALKRLAR